MSWWPNSPYTVLGRGSGKGGILIFQNSFLLASGGRIGAQWRQPDSIRQPTAFRVVNALSAAEILPEIKALSAGRATQHDNSVDRLRVVSLVGF